MYNVEDVHNPIQEQSLVIGSEGSYADALSNPRVFTYYPEKNLLLLVGRFTKTNAVGDDDYRIASVFQGLVGIHIDPKSITEKFRITHVEIPEKAEEEWKKECSRYTNSAKTCRKLYDGSEYCYTNQYIPEYCLEGATVESYVSDRLHTQPDNIIYRTLYRGDDVYTLSRGAMKQWNIDSPSKFTQEYAFGNLPRVDSIKIPFEWK